MEILSVKDLSFGYPNTENMALDGIDFSVHSGEFILLCGQSGCGKTTLMKLLKREIAPAGEKSGEIFICGKPQHELDQRTSAAKIGYVMQNPDSQIATDKVWHELSFGLENLGTAPEVIRRRVGEMASYFGIEALFGRKTDELSGGQKQLLNLASVMVLQPDILMLDEPTGQLDPIAASEFINAVHKLNRELGVTVILAEHRLEEAFSAADRVLVLDKGHMISYDTPEKTGENLKNHPMELSLPSSVRIFNAIGKSGKCPVTVRDGKNFLKENFIGKELSVCEYEPGENAVIEGKNLCFRYGKELPDVLRGTELTVCKGEFFCILGGNGTGKTTLLNVIAGLDKPYRGKVIIDGKPMKSYGGNALYRRKLALLPQNPETVFIKDSVYADLCDILEAMGVSKEKQKQEAEKAAASLGVTHLLHKHPYDLSGGEQQKCALAKLLITKPEILLLDEPTKGIDAFSKQTLKEIFARLKAEGMTILAVTHDVEFAAENADRCGLFFDGELLSADVPESFFSQNNFYTTAASRMARDLWKTAVTCSQVTELCKEEMEAKR